MKFNVDFITILVTFVLLCIFLIPVPMILNLLVFSLMLMVGGISNHTLGTSVYGIIISILSLSYMYLIVHFIRCLIAIFNKNCKSVTINTDNIVLDHKKLGNIELNAENIKNIDTTRRLIALSGAKWSEVKFLEVTIITKDNQKYTVSVTNNDIFLSEIELFNEYIKSERKYNN